MSLESWHAVVGLGTDGGQPLADRDALARGVHLLWTLRPDLGFPVGGYHVSRRAHRKPEWGCLNPENGLLPPDGATEWQWFDDVLWIDGSVARFDADACPPNGALYLPGNASLTVAQAGRWAAVRATGVGPAPRFEVLVAAAGKVRVVADEPAAVSNGGWSAELWCEGIVACRLSGDDMRVCTICFADAQETGGWERLHDEPILTPVVAPGTANEAANLQGAEATRAEAYGRLSTTLRRDARAALAEAFADVAELVEGMLRDGRDAMVPAEATGAAGARTPPLLGLPTGGSVALAAVDPDVSRMLGLYWHDPVQSGRWDYKVVAHHGAVRFPGPKVTFDALTTGDVGSPSVVVDGVAFVGTAGLEVVASGRTKALRVGAPRIGTAAGLRLEPTWPAVTLRFDGNPVGPFAAWRGARQVASGVAFLGAVTLEDADGIDAVTWSMGPLDLLEVELYERAGLVGDLTGYAWRLSPTTPEPVRDLELTDAGSAVEPTRLHADGTVDVATGIVGLDWAAVSPAHDVARPVRVHVGRASAAGETPVVRNADRPAAAFARDRAPGDHWAGPDVPHRWLERDLAPGTYAWSVRGIDVFGRLGEWSGERVLGVPTGTVPPPPDAVTAAYLDPADPYLSDDERALVERDGPGLLVEWGWPAERRVAAPEVEPNGEFRVYARRGDPNVLEGTVLAVTDLGDHSRLRTDCTVPGGADGLAGQRLRVGEASFEVVGNTAGAGARIEVAHLTAPTARPALGPFAIDLSASSPVYSDLVDARTFGGLIHTEPVGALPRVTSRIVSVVDGGASATVTLADELPPTPADVMPGRLVSGGIAFRVLAQTPGSATIEVQSAPQVDGTAALPAAGEAATLWPGARYRGWLPGAGELPAESERWALTLVAVSACDVDAIVLHDPVPPHLPRAAAAARNGGGLEGPLSNVARVVVPHCAAPPAVEVSLPPDDGGDIPAERAEPADWYGRAAYGLRFAAVPGAVGYRLLRASVAAVFESDRGARQAGADPYADGPFDDDGASEAWLAQNHPSVTVADLTADLESHPDAAAVLAAWRGWSAWFYPQKLNREVMALAELPCNEAAFGPAHDGIIAAPPFEDTLDGRGLGRFVYRVRSVDASGNTGPWSGAFPLVEVSDVTAPATPVLVSLRASENRVTAQWLKGPEPDLAEYRVWRAESREALDDVRRLAPLAVVPPASEPVLTYADEDLPGLRTFFYRVAAVDTAGNVSQPTAAAAARVVDTGPPDAPAWIAAEWVADGVRLAWRAAESGLTCVLQRRPLGGGVWQAVSPDLTAHARPRDFAFVDRAAVAGTAYEYRVLARDDAGNPSDDFATRQVWPP